MNEIKINGKKWTLKNLENAHVFMYNSQNYSCTDGDGVILYIKKDKSSMELQCFSGIPDSSIIIIDYIDFGTFNYAPNKIDGFDEKGLSFEERCVMIANYFCDKFCHKH